NGGRPARRCVRALRRGGPPGCASVTPGPAAGLIHEEVRMAHATAEEQVAALLDEVGETHHRVYRITEGTDDDWASWYADWLLRLSELPQVLGTAPVRSELVWLLVGLDKEYSSIETEEPWPSFYARRGRVRDPRRAVP